ncbi:MAG: penicillin-binding protein 2 [Lachnospiraceae bacterium]|nr:penicillin-binding protein 2 [Lachnospiraceae bacterium]
MIFKRRSSKAGKPPVRQGRHHIDSNREIGVITYVFLMLFIVMLVYLGYFTQVRSKTVINSNYNKRQTLLESRLIRGDILSREGNVLATTLSDNDGGYYRSYPYRNTFAHIVGYSTHGVLGIEGMENYTLLTCDGNIVSRISNDLAGRKNHGDNVYTTLDTKMQEAAYDAMDDRKGAVVAMDVKTGEILCVVSKPDFDPNEVIGRWDRLNEDTDNSPLLNRAFLGSYPPGSTFKIVTALEYLKEHGGNVSDYGFECKGSFEYKGSIINCYNEQMHGWMNFDDSFAQSCNSSFANISSGLDKRKFGETIDSLLFNKELPLPFKYSMAYSDIGASSSTDDLLQTGIGQGKTLISPVHMLLITSAIANDGILMRPYVISEIQNADGGTISKTRVKEYGRLIDERYTDSLKKMMREVVVNGTARRVIDTEGYRISGKTGSAEYSSNKSLSHAWFTGFATDDDRSIAVTVIVEGGGSGGAVAAPIAKRVFDAYFN